jgi:prepilin-type N-terminal cleavage/methylation domain-containing protein
MTNWRETIRKTRQQLGFTLIELTIVLALVGLVGSAIVMSVYQVYGINSSTLARVTAQNQVAFATKWITADAQQAQNIVTSGSSGLPVQLKWQNWDTGHKTTIIYSLSNNNLLRQSQEFDENGVLISNNTIEVARYISSNTYETCCAYRGTPADIATFLNVTGDPTSLTFQITSTVTGQRPSSATSIVRIVPKSIR